MRSWSSAATRLTSPNGSPSGRLKKSWITSYLYSAIAFLPTISASIRLSDEDKGRAGDDRGAGSDEGDVGVFHLAGAGAAGGLQGALDDVPETVDAAGAETA